MFRRMDDDGSKNLDYPEFRKGVEECGLELEEHEYKVFNEYPEFRKGVEEFRLELEEQEYNVFNEYPGFRKGV